MTRFAVLFDRDGTLIVDVPYNGDPNRVTLRPGARRAVELLRAAGARIGMITNQSGIARGLISRAGADAVNARVSAELGGLDTVRLCPHGPHDGCVCRKPRPGLVVAAADDLGVAPAHTIVVGDIRSDVEAARAAGATGILVPTPATLPEEIDAERWVVPDLESAARLILFGRARAWAAA